MVYGQMNEPPGNRLRVALTGLTMAESLPRRRPRRAVLRRQHLPLHAGRHRSVGAARPHAVRGGLPADAGRGNGPPAGAHHLDQDRLDHLDPGRVRAGGRPDRPVAGDHLRATSTRPSCCRATSPRSASTRRSTRSTRPRASSTRTSIGEEHYDTARARAGDAAALQGTARHHRDPRHGRAVAGRQAGRGARAQDPALPVAAVPRRRSVHRLAGQVRVAEGHDPRLQDDRRRRMRPPARAGVLHGRRDRRSVREGQEDRSKPERARMANTIHVDVVSAEEQIFSGEARVRRRCRARRASSASTRATRR